MQRRAFIKTAAAGTAAFALPHTLWAGSDRWKGANDRLNIAVIGIHGMGQSHISNFNALDNVEVRAICDVDENLFKSRVKEHFTDEGFKKPKIYTDLRKLFEDKDIDAVSIVTPNHWHTPAAIWAIQAGKHVTVEKPCCHTFWEGQKLVEAANKYDVVVQDGAEQRSNPCAQSMAEFLYSGELGEVYMGKGFCYKWRDTIGTVEPEPVPEGLHYDLWMGPAPEKPFTQNRFHYNWHWQWDYGNGDMGNQGVHEMDIARLGLGVKLPTKVSAMGGHFMFEDDQETPNDMMAVFEFPNPSGSEDKKKMLQFEVRHWITDNGGLIMESGEGSTSYMTSSENTIGNTFYGSKGFMVKTVDKWKTFMGREKEPGETGEGLGNHYKNFCDTIRTNNSSMLNAPIEEGFYSCALIHLANISYRVGRTLYFDPETMRIKEDEEANSLLTKEYREPYVVPENV
ncbi:MAG: Gfo/Idh/MocA family protein [Bacteroidales bacterium]